MEMTPPDPPWVVDPVSIVIAPELPMTADPVRKLIGPLVPEDPLSAVWMKMDPDVERVEAPEVT
jgi:hypothetical protein